MSLKKFENSFDNNHQKLGLALYGAILAQGLIGFFRPHRSIHQNFHLFGLTFSVFVKALEFSKHALYCNLNAIQFVIEFCRGNKERSYWYLIHWILGTVVSLVGIINIYTGLKAYHERTLKSTTLWTILFTVEVSFIGLIYLFQDKLEYMKKQGVIIGSESSILSSNQDIPQSQTQKELLPVACGRKRNALENLFD